MIYSHWDGPDEPDHDGGLGGFFCHSCGAWTFCLDDEGGDLCEVCDDALEPEGGA